MAIGRSPVWRHVVSWAEEQVRRGAELVLLLLADEEQDACSTPCEVALTVGEATDVVDCDSQWNSVGLIG